MISNRYKYDKKNGIPLNNVQLQAKVEVEKKIKNGIYTFEEVSCIICNNQSDFDILAEKDRYGLPCTTVACKTCGLLLINPRMTQASYNQFYNEEYRPLYSASDISTDFFFRRQYEHGQEIIKFIQQHSEIKDFNDKYVVEIGCGAGGILNAFKDKGARITGLDLGEGYLEYGKQRHNLNLEQGTIHSYDFAQTPDVIIYSHVLEHILDLDKELERIKAISHKDTIIYIEVPGVFSIHNPYGSNILSYLQNAHTYNFTLNSLNNLFSKHNIGLIYGDEFVHSLFKISKETDNHKIENIYYEEMKYLHKMEKRYNCIFFRFYKKIKYIYYKIYYKLFK